MALQRPSSKIHRYVGVMGWEDMLRTVAKKLFTALLEISQAVNEP